VAFHVTFDSLNTKYVANGGEQWGTLHNQITLYVSFKMIYFVLWKDSGEIAKPLF